MLPLRVSGQQLRADPDRLARGERLADCRALEVHARRPGALATPAVVLGVAQVKQRRERRVRLHVRELGREHAPASRARTLMRPDHRRADAVGQRRPRALGLRPRDEVRGRDLGLLEMGDVERRVQRQRPRGKVRRPVARDDQRVPLALGEEPQTGTARPGAGPRRRATRRAARRRSPSRPRPPSRRGPARRSRQKFHGSCGPSRWRPCPWQRRSRLTGRGCAAAASRNRHAGPPRGRDRPEWEAARRRRQRAVRPAHS